MFYDNLLVASPLFGMLKHVFQPHLSALHQALRLHQAQRRLRRFRRRHLRHGLLVDSYCVRLYIYIYMYISLYIHMSNIHMFCLSIYLSTYRSIDRNATTWPSWGAFQQGRLTRNGRANTLAGLSYEDWDVTDIRQGVQWIQEMLNSLKIDLQFPGRFWKILEV